MKRWLFLHGKGDFLDKFIEIIADVFLFLMSVLQAVITTMFLIALVIDVIRLFGG